VRGSRIPNDVPEKNRQKDQRHTCWQDEEHPRALLKYMKRPEPFKVMQAGVPDVGYHDQPGAKSGFEVLSA